METKEVVDTSIYHLYLPGHRKLVLFAAACIAILSPFTDTIYLPTLSSVAEDFDANDTLVALTVSIYLLCVGLGQLLWGPLSDHYGRKRVLYATLIIYEGLTIGCIFAESISTLIILRSLEGFVVGSSIVCAQAIVGDVFPVDERGEAMGTFTAPMLLGPIIAPIVGGTLSQVFGWRSTFVFLSIMTVPIMVLVVLCVPETHSWFVLTSIDKENSKKLTGDGNTPNNAQSPQYEMVAKSDQDVSIQTIEVDAPTESYLDVEIESKESSPRDQQPTQISNLDLFKDPETVPEAAVEELEPKKPSKYYSKLIAEKVHSAKLSKDAIVILSEKNIVRPPLISPWSVLLFATDLDLTPFYIIQFMSFAVMFTSLTVLALYLSESPYNLSEGIVGLTYIPVGIGMLIGSVIGGILSDRAAAVHPQFPEARLTYGAVPILFVIAGGIIFAFTLDAGVHLAVILIAQTALGYGQSAIMTTVLSYLSVARNSAGVVSVMLFLMFTAAALFVSISVDISNAIGLGYYFVILVGIFGVASIWGAIKVLSKIADEKRNSEPADTRGATEG